MGVAARRDASGRQPSRPEDSCAGLKRTRASEINPLESVVSPLSRGRFRTAIAGLVQARSVV